MFFDFFKFGPFSKRLWGGYLRSLLPNKKKQPFRVAFPISDRLLYYFLINKGFNVNHTTIGKKCKVMANIGKYVIKS